MRIIVPAVSVSAWIAIEVLVFLNPSGTLPVRQTGVPLVLFYTLSAVAAFVLPLSALGKTKRRPFFVLFFGGFLFLLLMSLLGGSLFHRDFHVYGTQAVMLYFIIFLLRLNDLGLVKRKPVVYRNLFTGAMTAFALWTAWLMLMAYAIVTRTEPRWIESTVYNLLNGIIGLFIVYSSVLLREHARRTVYLWKDTIFLDGRNISELLSPQENRILHAFLDVPRHTLTCRGLVRVLGATGVEEEAVKVDCETCMAERWTASECSVYRNLKNRIAATKKYLELLQIGTIVPVSEKPREIKEYGWCLRFFDDVRWDASDGHRKAQLFAHVRE